MNDRLPVWDGNGQLARVGVDEGGTFTDFVVLESGRVTVEKRLTVRNAPTMVVVGGLQNLGVGSEVPVVHGSTLATNALLERRGSRVALVATRGFGDVLEIGRQSRPDPFDLYPIRSPVLVPRSLRFEVDERINRHGLPTRALSDEQVTAVVSDVLATGARSVAVCLLFSFANPAHEQAIGLGLQRAGLDVSLSSDIVPEFREFERTSTTVANAYLRPVLAAHLEQLKSAVGRRLWMMQSDGTTVPPDWLAARPVRAILSGPAAGVVGALAVARAAERQNILTLDMGGTSTDVAFCPGAPILETQHEIGGIALNLPMLAIHTVGAGGGSIARRDVAGGLHVGPVSAGADPGPACYGRGGTAPTVTDANVVLGCLSRDAPLGGQVWLDYDLAKESVMSLTDTTDDTDPITLATAVIKVVNAEMARALRAISIERGDDPRQCSLVAFGGAGPLHAAALADVLDIPEVIVPRYPGVLSALGAALARVERSYSRTVMVSVNAHIRNQSLPAFTISQAYEEMERLASSELHSKLGTVPLQATRSLDCRYDGQSHEMPVPAGSPRSFIAGNGPVPPNTLLDLDEVVSLFNRLHKRRFGYQQLDRTVEIVTVRLRVRHIEPSMALPAAPLTTGNDIPCPSRKTVLWEKGHMVEAPIIEREQCGPETALNGPALVVQQDATTLIPSGWLGKTDPQGSLLLSRISDS